MCAGLVAVVASISGLNVVQLQLVEDLGASQSDLLWIINAYTLVLAALLMPVGAAGDRWGRKWVLLGGLGLFVAANVAAVLAGSVTQLLVARIGAGVAAAMIMPVTLSVITSTFPPGDRDRAVGVWAGFAGVGGILGLVASSVVSDHFAWPWVFAAPVAAAVFAFVVSLVVVPSSRDRPDGNFDVVGSVVVAVGIGAAVFAIQEGPSAGWSAPVTVLSGVVGVVALAVFVGWELVNPYPLIDLRVFRNRLLAAGSLNLLVTFAVMSALFLVLVQFLQAVVGFSAVRASVGLVPLAVVVMPLASAAPLLTRRVGFRAMFVTAGCFIAAGLASMAVMVSVDGGYWSVLPGLVLLAVGIGLAMTPATTAITGSLPVEDQGVASALNDTVREVGAAAGVALIGSVLSATYSSQMRGHMEGVPAEVADVVTSGIGGAALVADTVGPAADGLMVVARAAFLSGWSQAMWISAVLVAVATVAVGVLAPGRGRCGAPVSVGGGSRGDR